MTSNILEVQTMFAFSTRSHIPWNISQYLPARQYIDPIQIKDQKQQQKRKYIRLSQKPPQTISQKTFFIDETIKPTKDNPPPDKYSSLSLFDQKRNRQKSKTIKINPNSLKYTYLDWIQIENKKTKQPAVGKYNLMKTDQQIKAELKALSHKRHSLIEEKRHFYDGNQTNQVPGAGAYNPHLSVQLPPRSLRKDHKYWIKKHSQMEKKQIKKQRKSLAPTSYRPVSASFNSFDKITLEVKKSAKNGTRINSKLGFATSDARFDYRKEKKIKIQQKRPTSVSYNTMIEWKGKKSDPKTRNWARCLSARPSASVYY